MILQKVHFAFPQLKLYEFFIGFCLLKSNFLMPCIPENLNSIWLTQLLGLIRGRGPQANKRVEAEEVLGFTGTIRRTCRMLFYLLSQDDCYLGRMYEYLLLLVNFKIHMLTPMILLMALEVAGPFLLRKYPGSIRGIALQLADPNSPFNKKLNSYFTT